MKNTKFFFMALSCALIFALGCDGGTNSNLPPGQADFGYGSTENYIADTAKTFNFGESSKGTGCIYYVPAQLKSNPAPVVVFLHGMALQSTKIYGAHIDHIIKQGNILIFPQFNKEGVAMMSDTDQNVFLSRTVAILEEAFKRIEGLADLDNVTYYGHSLGGLLAATLSAHSSLPSAKNVILAHGAYTVKKNNPFEPDITPIDWKPLVKAVTGNVIILTGEDDSLAPSDTALVLYDELTNASSKVVYMVQTDKVLVSDHQGPATAKSGLASSLGGNPTLNTYDFRFYWAALDAALDDKTRVDFDMGAWMDGTPVLPVLRLAP